MNNYYEFELLFQLAKVIANDKTLLAQTLSPILHATGAVTQGLFYTNFLLLLQCYSEVETNINFTTQTNIFSPRKYIPNLLFKYWTIM